MMGVCDSSAVNIFNDGKRSAPASAFRIKEGDIITVDLDIGTTKYIRFRVNDDEKSDATMKIECNEPLYPAVLLTAPGQAIIQE